MMSISDLLEHLRGDAHEVPFGDPVYAEKELTRKRTDSIAQITPYLDTIILLIKMNINATRGLTGREFLTWAVAHLPHYLYTYILDLYHADSQLRSFQKVRPPQYVELEYVI